MKDKIKQILSENADISVDELNSLSPDGLLSELGLDSLNIMYVIAEIEQEFQFRFEEDDMVFKNFATLDMVENMINKYIRR